MVDEDERAAASSLDARFPAPLTPDRAFVVQLRQSSALTLEALSGRIEHIVSGRATSFTSVGELLGFMEKTLSRREEQGA
jgi:hypothetical protein